MLQQDYYLQILTILAENLNTPQPKLVPSNTIAKQMGLPLTDLRRVLKSMDGKGVIQTDDDLRYNLITREGLAWLE